jgi:hypothetical protein
LLRSFLRHVLVIIIIFILIVPEINSQQDTEPIYCINIEVTTANEYWAGTDNDVYLIMWAAHTNELGNTIPLNKRWELDGSVQTDGEPLFELGKTNVFRLTDNLPSRICEITAIRIEKSPDDWDGGWKLGGILIHYNDDPSKIIYQNSNINTWLEDNHRDWLARDFVPGRCPPPLPPPPGTPPLPQNCYVRKGSDDLTIQPDSDCDGIIDELDPNPLEPDGIDSDGDGIYDKREEIIGTDPLNPDTDGDNVPDGWEDINQNGVLDDGETDPLESDTDGDTIPDGEEDRDLDGLPDWYEVESDPDDPDSDEDGWWDGPTNVITYLWLMEIRCINEEEDIGDDELFIVVDDVRFPEDIEDLEGIWDLEEGDVIYPMIPVCRRSRSPDQTADYQAVVELWEDDIIDKSAGVYDIIDITDNRWQRDIINFGESGMIEVKRDDRHWYDDTIYEVTFKAMSYSFYDPHSTDANADLDEDGIDDVDEHRLSRDLSMKGLSDPTFPDIFLELDWVGAEQAPEPYSKIDVVSQFFYHDYTIHLDDGDYGGGEEIPYVETVYLRSSSGSPSAEGYADGGYFDQDRHGLFHYAIAVDEVGNGEFGSSSCLTLDDDGNIVCESQNSRIGLMIFKSDFLDVIGDAESIFFMHELGHALGLCHRPNDPNPPNVVSGPHCTPPYPPCSECRNCTHYWIDQDSDTAMGTGFRFNIELGIIGGGLGAGLGGLIGLAGGPVGFVIGAAIGGGIGVVIGGYGGAAIDSIDREVNYEDEEWESLELRGIRYWP